MNKLTEAGIIKALNNKSWLYEGLKKNVRHKQHPPYHHDVEDDIIPDNVNDCKDTDDFWLSDGFGYRCPNCNSAFMSPEQIGEYEKVECPYCEAIISPKEIDDDELEDYEVADDSDEDGEEDYEEEDYDEDEDYDDELEECNNCDTCDDDCEDEEDDEEFTELELLGVINDVLNFDNSADLQSLDETKKQIFKKYSKAISKNPMLQKLADKAKNNPKAMKLIKKLARIKRNLGSLKRKPDGTLTAAAEKKRAKYYAKAKSQLAQLRKMPEFKKAQAIKSKIKDKFAEQWSNIALLQMDEKAVMAVLNETIGQAFKANRDCIPFRIVDVTRGSYKPVSDTLTLETLIRYEDGVEDTARFVLEGVQAGEFELTETTGAFDFEQYRIIGNSSIVNESIIIN